MCAGKHPAAHTLQRARNTLGFHWDADVIRESVRDYGKNKKIVWLESDTQFHPVHRLAADVLVHALFFDVENQASPQGQEIVDAMSQVSQAMELMTEFFSTVLFGYLYSSDAVRRTR